MKFFIWVVFLLQVVYGSAQVGVKGGITYSNQYNKNPAFGKGSNKMVLNSNIGIEYEFKSHLLKPRFLPCFDSSGNIIQKRKRTYDAFLLDAILTSKGSAGVPYMDNNQQRSAGIIRLLYLSISPRINILSTPRKKGCPPFGCCDFEDYGKFKPYNNLYIGPRMDILIRKKEVPPVEDHARKLIAGATLSLNTQYICFSSGSFYTDLQVHVDFMSSYISDQTEFLNYSVLLMAGFKIRANP